MWIDRNFITSRKVIARFRGMARCAERVVPSEQTPHTRRIRAGGMRVLREGGFRVIGGRLLGEIVSAREEGSKCLSSSTLSAAVAG